jgi:hypothetical protein
MERLNLTKEMDELLYREAIAWLHHSRITWLQEGDQNTKKKIINKHQRDKGKNKIRKLKRPDGS